MDDELLQDFLVEAGEILELLNEQLVDLEQSPDDIELLNAVFRGFHTIKGGAGFLNIEAMVVVCHRAEDIFNLLRNGERSVDAALMDTMLPVLDVLNAQFDALRSGDEPQAAEPALIESLERVISGEAASAPAAEESSSSVAAEAAAGNEPDAAASTDEEITEEEFEALLDALEKPGAAAPSSDKAPDADKPSASTAADDEITDDEFEALLDDLHGKGSFSAEPTAAASPAETGEAKKSDKAETTPNAPAAGGGSGVADDEITDDEFEALLDDLHGAGKFSAEQADAGTGESKPKKPAAKPAAKPAPKPKSTAKQKPDAEAKPVAAKPNAEAKSTSDKASAATDKSAAGKEKSSSQAEATVRVDTSRLDDIMNLVGELVLARNRISRLGTDAQNEEMAKAVANLDVVTADLQLSVMKTRMQPVKKVFGRFPRVVRDLARSLKKEIKLEMQGEETDLDKNLVEALADPLVHLVRNSVDHGIEMPDERVKAGKTRAGTVVLAAEQEGDHILLTIEDDGKGMDPNVLRKIAVDKGLMDSDAAKRLDDRDCYSLIFMPGFSTKSEISDISGRGVGMDVVKTRISQLNGTVEIDSALGKGTRLSIKVPLTLAIMPTLMVRLEDQLFALPLVNVNEIFHLDLTKTNIVDGQLVVLVRERTLPLFYLNRWLVKQQSNAELPREGHVVVVHIGTQRVGLVVDELIGQEEVVIKPLGAMLQGTKGLAGATITGEGGIAIILDLPGLMRSYARRF